jgi:hypothetical protein
MIADPEPDGVIAAGQCQRAVVETDAYGISPANALEMQRWMPQIGLQKLKVSCRRSLGQAAAERDRSAKSVVWPDASQGRCPASFEIGQSLFKQLVKPTDLNVSFNSLIEAVSF